MSNKQEQDEPRELLGEDAENLLIEQACARLAQSLTHREDTARSSTLALKSALRSAAGYVAVALTVLAVAPAAAQDQPTERGVGSAAVAGVRAAQEEMRAANANERGERMVANSEEDRDERLEDRADEREDAREARVEEREDFDENAEARAERRETARTERWQGIREQGGLRNPDQLSATTLDELRTHARREARLRAIRNRAVDANDDETVARADAALEREARRHDVALTAMMTASRQNPPASANTVRPTAGGAQ